MTLGTRTANARMKAGWWNEDLIWTCATLQRQEENPIDSHIVIDSGATSTVVGKEWLSGIKSFTESKLRQISKIFRFGDGRQQRSCGRIIVSGRANATVEGGERIIPFQIITDVVNCNIPMMLSRNSLKAMADEIDFNISHLRFPKDTTIHLVAGATGHLQIPAVGGSLSCEQDDSLSIIKHTWPASTQEEDSISKSDIARIHLHLRHSTVPSLGKLFSRANRKYDKQLLMKIAQDCGREQSRAPLHNAVVNMNFPEYPGRTIFIDVCYTVEKSGHKSPYMIIVCVCDDKIHHLRVPTFIETRDVNTGTRKKGGCSL